VNQQLVTGEGQMRESRHTCEGVGKEERAAGLRKQSGFGHSYIDSYIGGKVEQRSGGATRYED
jgi:hypothetical protein